MITNPVDRPSRTARTRAAWTLADQILSSATNFILGVVVARRVGAEEYGVFAIGFALATIGLGMSRALSTDPYLVRHSHRGDTGDGAGDAATAGGVLSVAVFGGTALGAVLVVVGLLVGGALAPALVTFGVALPLFFAQDAVRYRCFAIGRPQWATLSDAVWLAMLLSVLVVPPFREAATTAPLVVAWTLGLGAALLPVVRRGGLRLSLTQARSWLRANADLNGRFLVEFLLLAGGTQAVVFALAALAGYAETAYFRGATALLGPASVLMFGVAAVAVPEGARALHRGSTGVFVRIVLAHASVVAGGVLVTGLAVGFGPEVIGRTLLGETWIGAREVVVPLSLAVAGSAAMSGFASGLRVLEAARASLRVNLVSTVLVVTGGVVGAAMDGARGAALGLIVPSVAGVLLLGLTFRTELRRQSVSAIRHFGAVDS